MNLVTCVSILFAILAGQDAHRVPTRPADPLIPGAPVSTEVHDCLLPMPGLPEPGSDRLRIRLRFDTADDWAAAAVIDSSSSGRLKASLSYVADFVSGTYRLNVPLDYGPLAPAACSRLKEGIAVRRCQLEGPSAEPLRVLVDQLPTFRMSTHLDPGTPTVLLHPAIMEIGFGGKGLAGRALFNRGVLKPGDPLNIWSTEIIKVLSRACGIEAIR